MKESAVLLVNTGTPPSCAPRDVRKYLTQFLLDGRVIDLPLWLREIVVKGFIVPFRYKKSAKAYARVWTEQGSPLLLHSNALRQCVEEKLGVKVALGMRYGSPSIEQGLRLLAGASRIVIVPLFPQYASATSGSVIEEAMRCLSHWQVIPELALLGPFMSNELFLDTWIQRAKAIDFQMYDHVIFSFHGLPLKHIKNADRYGCCLKKNCCQSLHAQNFFCYSAQCKTMGHELAERLSLSDYSISFQSRLGLDRWLSPYTVDVIRERRKRGDKRLLVFAPSFVADCLETTYEIGMEAREEFMMHGGDALDLVPSLNCEPAWVDALCHIVNDNL